VEIREANASGAQPGPDATLDFIASTATLAAIMKLLSRPRWKSNEV
jgi:hypothetical protein